MCVTYLYEMGKICKICKRNLRVYAGRVCVTYVYKMGKNCKNCKRNLGGGGGLDLIKCVSHVYKVVEL